MVPTVTAASLRLALRKITETTCGSAPSLIRVLIPSSQVPRVYIASIPLQHRREVYDYLARNLEFSVPHGGDPLVLRHDEATTILKLAYRQGDEQPIRPSAAVFDEG